MDRGDCAFVTWVVHSEEYVAAAAVLGASLRRVSPGIARICIVGADLSSSPRWETVLRALALLFDYVVPVPVAKRPLVHHHWGSREGQYVGWISKVFTKLEALRVAHERGFRRIFLLDADCMALRDFSDLFALEAPAGVLSIRSRGQGPGSPGAGGLSGRRRRSAAGGAGESEWDSQAFHGKKVPGRFITYALRHFYGFRGAFMLLDTETLDDYDALKEAVDAEIRARGSFGNAAVLAGPDELLFTEYFAQKGWTHIHESFCATSWHVFDDMMAADGRNDANQPNFTPDPPCCLHFVSQKPWDGDGCESWPDYEIWYNEARALLFLFPEFNAACPWLLPTLDARQQCFSSFPKTDAADSHASIITHLVADSLYYRRYDSLKPALARLASNRPFWRSAVDADFVAGRSPVGGGVAQKCSINKPLDRLHTPTTSVATAKGKTETRDTHEEVKTNPSAVGNLDKPNVLKQRKQLNDAEERNVRLNSNGTERRRRQIDVARFSKFLAATLNKPESDFRSGSSPKGS